MREEDKVPVYMIYDFVMEEDLKAGEMQGLDCPDCNAV
jgi:hypothetical protein